MTNYNYANGDIGRIDGRMVRVTAVERYNPRKTELDVIYALSFGPDEDLTLMLNGKEIGVMSPQGMVTYNEEKKAKAKAKPKTEEKKEKEEVKEIPTPGEIDLEGMSVKIDEFLQASLARDFFKEFG